MRFVFFDVEAMGKDVTKDEIVQFSAIVTDKKLEIIGYYDLYCYTTNFDPNSEAIPIHGIDYNTMIEKSEYKFLEDQLETCPLLYTQGNLWVAFNADFDVSMSKNNLDRYGAPKLDFGPKITSIQQMKNTSYFDISGAYMNYKGKEYQRSKGKDYRLRLVEVAEIELAPIATLQKIFTKQFGGEASAHNALFDSYLLYLLARKDPKIFL